MLAIAVLAAAAVGQNAIPKPPVPGAPGFLPLPPGFKFSDVFGGHNPAEMRRLLEHAEDPDQVHVVTSENCSHVALFAFDSGAIWQLGFSCIAIEPNAPLLAARLPDYIPTCLEREIPIEDFASGRYICGRWDGQACTRADLERLDPCTYFPVCLLRDVDDYCLAWGHPLDPNLHLVEK